jgi:hypothetical protein
MYYIGENQQYFMNDYGKNDLTMLSLLVNVLSTDLPHSCYFDCFLKTNSNSSFAGDDETGC